MLMKSLVFMIRFFVFLAIFIASNFSLWAQRNDLMIVAYYDARLGDGYGIALHNPTSQNIDLSNYWIKTQNNGGNPQPVTFSAPLSGTINAGQTIIIGNNDYCNNCSFDINLGFATGVNGNDAIAITRGNTLNFVDMVNLWNVDVSPRINGTNNGLTERIIRRSTSNCTRYTSIAGSGANSWPDASNVNVTGWTVVGPGTGNCLSRNFTLVSVPQPSLPPTITACQSTPITLNSGIQISVPLRWSTGATTPTITVNQSGTYILTVQPGSCEIKDTVVVNLFSAPQLNLKDSTVCYNTPVTLDAGPTGPYLWNTGEVSRTISVLKGKYWVRAGSGNCTAVDTSEITQTDLPVLNLPQTEKICKGMLTSYVAPKGFDSYKWSTGDTGRSFVKFNFSGTVFLDAQLGKCLRKDTIQFVTDDCPFEFPNIITPDGNGFNDRWMVKTNWDFLNSEIEVFDRWGRLLLTNTDLNAYGPGFDASSLPSGTYFVKFTGIIPTGKTITHDAWVEVLR